jgi:Tfp pilus assembly protein PilX
MRRSIRQESGPRLVQRREDGMALITVVLVIFLLTATALASIDFTGQEARAGGQSRATMRSLYAADAGIELAISRIQPPADLTAFSFNLADGTLVESRTRTEVGAQAIGSAGGATGKVTGPPPDGYSITIGKGGFHSDVFVLNATAVGTN